MTRESLRIIIGLASVTTALLAPFLFGRYLHQLSDRQTVVVLTGLCLLAAVGGVLIVGPFWTEIFGPYPVYP